jgi:hypothetical protein
MVVEDKEDELGNEATLDFVAGGGSVGFRSDSEYVVLIVTQSEPGLEIRIRVWYLDDQGQSIVHRPEEIRFQGSFVTMRLYHPLVRIPEGVL